MKQKEPGAHQRFGLCFVIQGVTKAETGGGYGAQPQMCIPDGKVGAGEKESCHGIAKKRNHG